MFDICTIFKSLEGKTFTLQELLSELEQFWCENLEDMPAEFSPRDLLLEGQRRGWIQQAEQGKLLISLNKTEEAA